MRSVKRILVLRFSSIGDIVLTTPVLRCVKRKYPDAELHFFTKRAFAGILEADPHVDVVHTLHDDLQENIATLKALDLDVIIDLHNNLRTLRVKRALGVKRTYSFPKLNIAKWLYVNLKWDLMPPTSIVERYFKAVAALDVVNDGMGLDFFIPEDKETSKDDIPMGHWMGYAACVIGGSFATKRFPEHKWKALLKQVNYPIILLGGPEDTGLGDAIAATDPDKIYNACGKFSLMESADLVRKSKVVISNDTGLMHIAAAFQKPMISLWGNTTPELGMFPYYGANNLKDTISPKFTIAEVQGLSCRPCSKIGHNACPRGHFKCMQDIDEQLIINDLDDFWRRELKKLP